MNQTPKSLPVGQDPRDPYVAPIVWKESMRHDGGIQLECDLTGCLEIYEVKYSQEQIDDEDWRAMNPFKAGYYYSEYNDGWREFATLDEAKAWLTQIHYDYAREFVQVPQWLPFDPTNPPDDLCWWWDDTSKWPNAGYYETHSTTHVATILDDKKSVEFYELTSAQYQPIPQPKLPTP